MAASENLKALVDQMPNADGRGMYCTDIDKDKIEKAVAEIVKGGRENILGLIDMLDKPGSDQDAKPHYALHCVGNCALVSKDENVRRQFAETLASQLTSDRSKYVRGFLCQELQWAGRREAVTALGRLLTDEELVDPAAMALVAIKDGAAEPLRAALPQAKGRCRLVVLHSLAALGDAGSAAEFRAAIKDPDREVRLAACAGLAKIGDATAVDLLLQAAGAEPGWERIQATKYCLVLAEKLLVAGKKQDAMKIYSSLRDSRSDPSEKYVRDLAEKALAG
ncbi:MAG: HEAT repeat domain-containing protein [Thermoguttaceae bacterium]|jgi:HEAT repeat protein